MYYLFKNLRVCEQKPKDHVLERNFRRHLVFVCSSSIAVVMRRIETDQVSLYR